LLKPLRATALTAACLAVFALGACSDGDAADTAGDTPPPASSSAPAPGAGDGQTSITGEWEYIPEGYTGPMAGFTVDADGTVTKFWKEGTKGVGSATLAHFGGEGYKLEWKYTSETR